MRTLRFPYLLTLSLLGACQNTPLQQAPAVDPAAQKLEAAIKSVPPAAAMSVGPESAFAKPVYSPKVTVSYLGDARNLLEDAAKGNGMTFLITGPEPRLPIYVQIHAKELTLEAFLEQVARQLSQRADVVMRNGRKTIELRYRGSN